MSLSKLIASKKTVFTVEDVSKIFDINNRGYLKVLLLRMLKRTEILRIKRGIYTYTRDYNRFELANKLKRPSYVSFERVLYDNGVIFQDMSSTITSISNNSYSETIDAINFQYFKIKNEILYNPIGISEIDGVKIASIERAICDTIYLSKKYYFDNLSKINLDSLKSLSRIYNKRTIQEVDGICST